MTLVIKPPRKRSTVVVDVPPVRNAPQRQMTYRTPAEFVPVIKARRKVSNR